MKQETIHHGPHNSLLSNQPGSAEDPYDKVNKMAHVYLDPHNERTVDTVQQIKEVQQEMRERGISSLPVYVGEGQDEYRNGQQVHA